MELEFYSTNDLSPALLREIEDFLDSQNTSHPFQFPQWNVGARFALLRDKNIRWFTSFGTHHPLGTFLPTVRVAIVNRGPVCDDLELWNEATGKFLEQLKREGFMFVDAVPEWVQAEGDCVSDGLHQSKWRVTGEPRASLRLNITEENEELLAGFRKNSRYEIRRAERFGVVVAPARDEEDIESFLAVYFRVAARKGFQPNSADELRQTIRWLADVESRGALLLARHQDVVYGGAIIVRSGRRCWYMLGATEKHQNFNVGHILQWQALLWAKARGCCEYDFGGFTPGLAHGPAWFKAGFGGSVVRFVPEHRCVLRSGYYQVFRLATQVRALNRTPRASSAEPLPIKSAAAHLP
jgi:hypothetical protein